MHDPAFTPYPINWGHPLNHKRSLWLLGVPPLDGGRSWYDLCGPNHGSLNGGAAWTATPFGHQGVRFNGSSSRVELPSVVLGQSDFTLAIWMRPDLIAGMIQFLWSNDDGSNRINGEWGLIANFNGSSVVAGRIGWFDYKTLTGFGTTGSVLTQGGWHRAVVARVGSGITLYLNGLPVASSTSTTNFAAPVGSWVGDRPASSSPFTGAACDASMIVGRGWSAADVALDYDLSRRGYPDILNRLSLIVPILSGQDIVARGGAATGGSATTTLTGTFGPVGGARVGGGGQASVVFAPSPSGVGLAGGSAQVGVGYRPTTIGGVGGSGTALQAFADSVEVTGGSASGGSATGTAVLIERSAGGVGGAGTATQGIGHTVKGGVISGGVAIATTIIHQPVGAGGAVGAGTSQDFVTFIHYPTGGSVVRGTCLVSLARNVAAVGGVRVDGAARLTLNDVCEVGGGATASGQGDTAAVYQHTSTEGVLVKGFALRQVAFTNPTRLTYHRFAIGDVVYAPSPIGDSYLRQAVRAIYSYNELYYYDVGIGWFPDRLLLSYQQYRQWLGRR